MSLTEIFGFPIGSRLAPDRGGVLITSAKDFGVEKFWTVVQETCSSSRNRLSSSLQLGPPLPQRWKNKEKRSHEKERKLWMKKPTGLEATKNLKV